MTMTFAWVVIGQSQKLPAGTTLTKKQDEKSCKGAVNDSDSVGSREKGGMNDYTLHNGQR
jgi:hypothetical protein